MCAEKITFSVREDLRKVDGHLAPAFRAAREDVFVRDLDIDRLSAALFGFDVKHVIASIFVIGETALTSEWTVPGGFP